jgi:hypothetical protein
MWNRATRGLNRCGIAGQACRGAEILLLALSLLPTEAFSGDYDSCEYGIMYSDNQIGVLSAKKAKDSSNTTYRLLTELTASLIKEFHITYDLSVSFDHGYLTKAFIRTAVNQSNWDSTSIRWQDSRYYIKKLGEEPYYLNEPKCTLSTACLYFRRPAEGQVFSEQYSKSVTVKQVKPNVYRLKLPSGNANVYYYDDQGLKKVVVNDTPVQIRFVRL